MTALQSAVAADVPPEMMMWFLTTLRPDVLDNILIVDIIRVVRESFFNLFDSWPPPPPPFCVFFFFFLLGENLWLVTFILFCFVLFFFPRSSMKTIRQLWTWSVAIYSRLHCKSAISLSRISPNCFLSTESRVTLHICCATISRRYYPKSTDAGSTLRSIFRLRAQRRRCCSVLCTIFACTLTSCDLQSCRFLNGISMMFRPFWT